MKIKILVNEIIDQNENVIGGGVDRTVYILYKKKSHIKIQPCKKEKKKNEIKFFLN